MTIKDHQVLLTDAEWEQVYEVYPKGIPVIHPYLLEFAQLAKTPESIIESSNQYREYAWKCHCWMCNYMLSLPVITGYHLYLAAINKICAGGDPHVQLN